MSKARWSPKDFKDNGLIEVNGVFVKASSQVAKKVDKITVDFNAIPDQHRNLTPKELIDIYNKTPFEVVSKSYVGDTFLLPNGEYIDVLYKFLINPCPAPRMTQSDKWKTDPDHYDPKKRQRKPVANYFAFRRHLQALCLGNCYKLTGTLNILFVIPFPKSYSKKKQLELHYQPHRQRPDRDNYLKSFQDSFAGDDGYVWDGRTIKVWGEIGMIIIF